jgi:hypothetical protein
MKTRVIVLALAGTTALAGCNRSENYEQASWVENDGRYTVTLSGKRKRMAHDPVSIVLGSTYEETFVLDLPRLSGTITGMEIPVRPGGYGYLGQVEITGNRMQVTLYYNKTGVGTGEPLSWNGRYVLVR